MLADTTEGPMPKRVINGKTYNTASSTLVARYRYEDDKDYPVNASVYQTRGGAFFIVHATEIDRDEPLDLHFEAADRDTLERLVEHADDLEIIMNACWQSHRKRRRRRLPLRPSTSGCRKV